MGKKIIFAFFLLAGYVLPAYSQQPFEEDRFNAIKVFDANGKPFENPNTDIAGSPFFIDSWKYGMVTLTNNDVYSKRLLRLDFEKQEIHYLSETNIEMTLPKGFIKRVILTDSVQPLVMQYDFQSGFPIIDKQDEKFLYHVLVNGKIKMLESIRKEMITQKNDFTGEISKEFRTYKEYYLFSNKSIQRVKKDKSFLLNIFSNKKDQIEEYIKTNKFTCKSIEEIQKITDYYNLLQ